MAFIGEIIDDKYEILKLIGVGGMSKVYLAMDRRLNKQWAVKEIEKRARDKDNEIVIQSAIAEANLIKQLDYKSIVRIVDIIDNGNVIYIIEDYIEGETLGDILEKEGPQPQESVIEWAIQICEALNYMHNRKPPIIYRDMKPGNVMLKPDGNIMVIDFGIAREYKDKNLADTVCLGTKGYAAPEQFGGIGQTDQRTDIYCLGVTLYHLLTGQNPCEPPYEIYPIRYWNPQLSAGLEAIIQKCTKQNPNDRYQDCTELLYALNHYEEYGAKYKAMQKQKLKKFIVAVASMLICVFVGVLGLGMRTHTNNNDYNQNIIKAEKASSSKEKADFYAKAIDIKPNEIEAYLKMIEVFKDDVSFSIEEESELQKKLNKNLSELKEQPEYDNLAFEIGKLYWYYYDYGQSDDSNDNQITRMKSSIQWFEDSAKDKKSDNYLMSVIYSSIGKFNRDINLNIEEASDKGKYSSYWKNIYDMVKMISNEKDENEIIELEVFKLAMYSMETYARKFKSDGIEQETMMELYNKVEKAVSQVSTNSDKTEALKKAVLNRCSSTKGAINNAYKQQEEY